MKHRPTHGWCPSCAEMSAINRRSKCLWCGKLTRPRQPDKPVSRAFLTDAHLRVLHRHYMAGAPVEALAERIYKRIGFESVQAAELAIVDGFDRLALRAFSPRRAVL